ncbi:hypothetical protein C5167_036104, partial [Papaver somniferum]
MQKSFTKPRLLILTDPRTDHQLLLVTFPQLHSVKPTHQYRHKWDVTVHLFFYREPGETKDQEADESAAPVADFGVTEYGGAGMMKISIDQYGGYAQWVGDAVAAPTLATVRIGLVQKSLMEELEFKIVEDIRKEICKWIDIPEEKPVEVIYVDEEKQKKKNKRRKDKKKWKKAKSRLICVDYNAHHT